MTRRIASYAAMPKKPDKYRSPLERRPKFVKAIGMVSIENASLETLLAELLAALLGIHGEFGILIYFTPKAAIARVDMIENVIEPSVGNHQVATKVRIVVKRAKAVIGKRHDVMHALWTLSDDPAESVAQIFLPSWKGGEVKLSALDKLVGDYRSLIEEVGPLIDEVQKARGFGWKAPFR